MIGIGIGIPFGRRGGIDADAAAFIAAAGITDPTQQAAINTLVKNLKGQGNLNNSFDFWSGILYAHPHIGGSASSNKFNLKNPLDTDAAFRLGFNGGWTFSATGSTPNGTNAYADTFFNPSAQGLSLTNSSLYIYQRQAPIIGTTRTQMGARDTASTDTACLIWGNAGSAERSTLAGAISSNYAPPVAEASAGILGSKMATLNGDRNLQLYANGNSRGSAAAQTTSQPNFNIYLAAMNVNGTAAEFFNREIAFDAVLGGVSAANALLWHQIIQQFQTDLGRAV
jgi:hypothetical protein